MTQPRFREGVASMSCATVHNIDMLPAKSERKGSDRHSCLSAGAKRWQGTTGRAPYAPHLARFSEIQ